MANHRLDTGHKLQGLGLILQPVTVVWHLCLEGCHLPSLHTGVVVQGSLSSVPSYLSRGGAQLISDQPQAIRQSTQLRGELITFCQFDTS